MTPIREPQFDLCRISLLTRRGDLLEGSWVKLEQKTRRSDRPEGEVSCIKRGGGNKLSQSSPNGFLRSSGSFFLNSLVWKGYGHKWGHKRL